MVAQGGTFEWQAGLQRAWDDVAAFAPRALIALLLLAAGWIVAKLSTRAAARVLRAMHLARLIDRAGLGVAIARAGVVDPVRVVSQIVFYIVMLLAVQLALSVFGPNAITGSVDALIAFIPALVVALAILVVAGLLARFVGNVTRASLSGVQEANLLASAAVVGVWTIGAFAAVNQIGIAPDVTRILFVALVFGLALTFVIKFGVGGIWSARDRFWPGVYDRIGPLSGADSAPARTLDLRRNSDLASRAGPPAVSDPLARPLLSDRTERGDGLKMP